MYLVCVSFLFQTGIYLKDIGQRTEETGLGGLSSKQGISRYIIRGAQLHYYGTCQYVRNRENDLQNRENSGKKFGVAHLQYYCDIFLQGAAYFTITLLKKILFRYEWQIILLQT